MRMKDGVISPFISSLIVFFHLSLPPPPLLLPHLPHLPPYQIPTRNRNQGKRANFKLVFIFDANSSDRLLRRGEVCCGGVLGVEREREREGRRGEERRGRGRGGERGEREGWIEGGNKNKWDWGLFCGREGRGMGGWMDGFVGRVFGGFNEGIEIVSCRGRGNMI